MKITKKYLVFPVNTLAKEKELYFKENGKTVYHLNIKLDTYNPDFFAYIDLARYLGKELEISVEPEMEVAFTESDTMDIENGYKEPMRPQIHFSTKNGWINDPNGLICLNGVYHMFYQYNPAAPYWENMHWGHAESRDLIHWVEKDTALFPDERGTMFSGSAVWDEKNLLGLDADNPAALLFYTTTAPFCQNMSYSTDGFKTLVHYSKNPVVPHIVACNRDPKVIFCQELGCYLMALYLDRDVYALFRSNNLTDWTELQRIPIPGDSECPDIFPLCCGAERKWILMGASDYYLVGQFADGKFVAEQGVQRLHCGSQGYAGQSFSNLPNGRVVRVEWDRWEMPAKGFCGQMSIPVEMSLCKHEGIYYLQAAPIQEIERIFKDQALYHAVVVNPECGFAKKLDDTAQLIRIKSAFLSNGKMELTVFGRTVSFDFDQNEAAIGDTKAPISITKDHLDITMVIDRCSIELFLDDGKIYVTCLNQDTLMDRNLPYITVTANQTMLLDSMEIHALRSIWE